jgi:hypothetical protein
VYVKIIKHRDSYCLNGFEGPDLKNRSNYIEKRTYPRLIINTLLTYTLIGSSDLFSGMCNNMSHSGIHFSAQNTIPVGTSLEVSIDLQNDKLRPLKAVVEVVRVDATAVSTFGIAGKIVEYK